MVKIMLLQSRNVVGSSGGAERVLCDLSNGLVERGYEVVAVCDEYKKGNPFYPLNKEVKFFNLSAKTNSFWKNFKTQMRRSFDITSFRFAKLIKAEKPDVIICFFIKDVYRVKFLQCHNIPIVLMQHSYPDYYFGKLKFYNRMLTHFLLRNMAFIQVLLPTYVEQVRHYVKNVPIKVIPDFVPSFADDEIADLSVPKNKIVYVARIEENKRQHLLIEAFAKIAAEFPEWKVELWGSVNGVEYKEHLDTLIIRYSLVNRVLFMGTTTDITDVYKNADIFAITSAFEGFSLATTEAMSLGLPVVGLASTCAINEIVLDGKTGLLAADGAPAYADALRKLMNSKELRMEYGLAAHYEMAKFSTEHVLDIWEESLKNILPK